MAKLLCLEFDRITVYVDKEEFEIMVLLAMEKDPTQLSTSLELTKELRAQGYGDDAPLLAILARQEAQKRLS